LCEYNMWWNIDLRVRFFKSSLMVLNGSLHGEFYAGSAGIGESILKTQHVEKKYNHIKALKLSRQKPFFAIFSGRVFHITIFV